MQNTNQIRSALVLLVATSGCLVSCQFLPQSHLGRLVQSIASPLVLSSQAGYRSNDDSDSYGDPSSSGYYSGGSAGPSGDISGESGETGAHNGASLAGRGRQQQVGATGLQQAPSQQRGVPQHYYNSNDDERGDVGSAPSNNKHTQDYQMGAYLGPSMDDKEINGAFNSNDERDDDDGPAGYDGPSSAPAMGRGRAAASNTYHNSGGDGYGPAPGYGRQQGAGSNYAGSAGYDEDGADEDDAPVPRARHQGGRSSANAAGYGRSGLSQAASQYQQRGSSGQPIAAANGYAPYGYGTGPIDLNGLMAGVNGDPSAGYQVYQGDGSYPGANYYQQQAQQGGRQRPASRSQAASMNNGYYGSGNSNSNNNNNNDGYSAPASGRNKPEANNYNDDRDTDNDED